MFSSQSQRQKLKIYLLSSVMKKEKKAILSGNLKSSCTHNQARSVPYFTIIFL